MMIKNLILLALMLTVSISCNQKEISLFGNLKFGPHEVGVKQLTFIDTLKAEHREICIKLWYPAKHSNNPLKFVDYLDYGNELKHPELLKLISLGITGKEKQFSIDSLELLLNTKMKATKRAEAKNGKFPLLIWSIRYETVEYQNILSEYLASHGYVVAFAEDSPNSPYPWELQSLIEKTNVLNQQVIDINTSIEYLKSNHNIDKTKIGLLSWSYAGESAILTQANNPDIDLVIGLSSIGFSNGVYSGNELSKKIDMENVNVPYLLLFEQVAPNGNTRTPPTLFDSMHSNSRYVSFRDLTHGNFNVMEGMIPGILNTNKVQSWSKGGKVAQIAYETICEMTVSFLDAVFHEKNLNSFDKHGSNLKEHLPENFFLITSPVKKKDINNG